MNSLKDLNQLSLLGSYQLNKTPKGDIVAAPSSYTQQQKKDLVQEYNSSNLSPKQFAIKMGIPITTFRNWIPLYGGNKRSYRISEPKPPILKEDITGEPLKESRGEVEKRLEKRIQYLEAIIGRLYLKTLEEQL